MDGDLAFHHGVAAAFGDQDVTPPVAEAAGAVGAGDEVGERRPEAVPLEEVEAAVNHEGALDLRGLAHPQPPLPAGLQQGARAPPGPLAAGAPPGLAQGRALPSGLSGGQPGSRPQRRRVDDAEDDLAIQLQPDQGGEKGQARPRSSWWRRGDR